MSNITVKGSCAEILATLPARHHFKVATAHESQCRMCNSPCNALTQMYTDKYIDQPADIDTHAFATIALLSYFRRCVSCFSQVSRRILAVRARTQISIVPRPYMNTMCHIPECHMTHKPKPHTVTCSFNLPLALQP